MNPSGITYLGPSATVRRGRRWVHVGRGSWSPLARILTMARWPDGAPCQWCSRYVTWDDPNGATADHVDGDALNDRAENVVVACRSCNSARGTAKRNSRRDAR